MHTTIQSSIRSSVADYVFYSVRGWTHGDETPSEIRRGAFRLIRRQLERGEPIQRVISHIDRLAFSASLA